MHDAIIKGLHLQASLEMKKHYSRDALTPGRVKVVLKDSDGLLCDDSIPTKQVLLVKCAEMCARHAERPRRLAEIKRFEEQLCSLKPLGGPGGKASGAGKGEGAGTSQGSASKASGKSNKKKGKKK